MEGGKFGLVKERREVNFRDASRVTEAEEALFGGLLEMLDRLGRRDCDQPRKDGLQQKVAA
jgi:hypothetical protein